MKFSVGVLCRSTLVRLQERIPLPLQNSPCARGLDPRFSLSNVFFYSLWLVQPFLDTRNATPEMIPSRLKTGDVAEFYD